MCAVCRAQTTAANALKPRRAFPVPEFAGRVVLRGMPATTDMYFNGSPTEEWRREYMGQWTVPGTALEAEERRQRRAGKTNLMGEIADEARDRELSRLREAAMQPVPAHMLPEEFRPKPPTLREWLGDRVSELGRWADVLRDQPVPAGMIVSWAWVREGMAWLPEWTAKDGTSGHLLQHEVVDAVCDDLSRLEFHDWAYEAVQTALFTRHPDVQPTPKPAEYPWSPEDQHETIARDA